MHPYALHKQTPPPPAWTRPPRRRTDTPTLPTCSAAANMLEILALPAASPTTTSARSTSPPSTGGTARRIARLARISCSVIALPPNPLHNQVRSQIHNKREHKQHNSDQKKHAIVRIAAHRFAQLRCDRRRQRPHRIQHARRHLHGMTGTH